MPHDGRLTLQLPETREDELAPLRVDLEGFSGGATDAFAVGVGHGEAEGVAIHEYQLQLREKTETYSSGPPATNFHGPMGWARKRYLQDINQHRGD